MFGKQRVYVLVLALAFAIYAITQGLAAQAPARAETPCDFKGISVGNKMSREEIMKALGVTKYKTNPVRPPFEEGLPLMKKYGLIAAAEIQNQNIGPYCNDTSCRVPFGVSVGNDPTPVSVFVSFDAGQITEIDVSFSETFFDEILPILNQKYGDDWKVERDDMLISNYETGKGLIRERITMNHVSNGTNQSTKDHCQISASNLDLVFEHHDAYGPYHSVVVIKLVSKNF
jgi:hypothetical protein